MSDLNNRFASPGLTSELDLQPSFAQIVVCWCGRTLSYRQLDIHCGVLGQSHQHSYVEAASGLVAAGNLAEEVAVVRSVGELK